MLVPRSRPIPRLRTALRKTAKWGGAAVTVILVVVWVGSAWWAFHMPFPFGMGVGVADGRAEIVRILNRPALHPYVPRGLSKHDARVMWWFDGSVTSAWWYVWIPLWALALPTLALSTVGWRRDAMLSRRVRVGLCPECGYDRAGLAADAVCPECGAAPVTDPHSGHAAPAAVSSG